MSDSCPSTTAGDQGLGTAITAVHPDIIQTHILTRLDGPTLASTSCASSQIHSICTEESLWKTICNSNWPSTTDPRVQEIISAFPSGHRSFCSDSYPRVHRIHHKQEQKHLRSRAKSKSPQQEPIQTKELISAIDIHYGNEIIYSKVVVTETSTRWFECSPLRLDLLDTKETEPTQVILDGEETCMAKMEKNLRLSWILIDPARKRAVNLSSVRPVDVQRHWLTGEIQVSYATVVSAGVGGGLVKCEVNVTCGGKEGEDLHVREIRMQVEDLEGKVLSGKECLGILHGVMESKRVNGKIGEEKKLYETFLEMRLIWRERRQKRERTMDMVCLAIGATIFMAFWVFILFR